jgi:hypothetical protein
MFFSFKSSCIAAVMQCVLIAPHVLAQDPPADILQPLLISKVEADIRVDGVLDEAVWQQFIGLGEMLVVDPDTLQPTAHETVSRMFYTDKGLYIGIQVQQPVDTLLARLSSRDIDINRDGVMVYLDTSGDGRYSYYFGVNLGGSA